MPVLLRKNFEKYRVSPDADGVFRANVPDFSADKTASSFQPPASFGLLLTHAETLNHIASSLQPELSLKLPPSITGRVEQAGLLTVAEKNLSGMP